MPPVVLLAITLAAAGLRCSTPVHTNSVEPRDPHSFARPDEAVVTHLDLDLVADFDRRELLGTARLAFRNVSGARTLHLDCRGLNIRSVIRLPKGDTATFTLSEPVPFLGSDLAIAVTPETKEVEIAYSTSPDAAALQWLTPAQTSGKKHPFLFTQSQAILARTWVPCQDGPGVRMTYSARIRVPRGLMAVMSASNPTSPSADGVYTFDMRQPIPSYLLALAVGNIAFRPLGTRSGVYAEPEIVKKAAWELTDTEKMIAAAESLYGPYRWERYDLIVLPPSFPFGGMENPRLTFATPTILAGDRSLVSLVAHELAHSWSGNLVTNATWNDFWLNEGFTTYFENRIMEALYGRPYAEMLASLSLTDLRSTIAELGSTNPDTRLKLDLNGRDPDIGVSDIAYNKGALFLRHCEETLGRPAWDKFLKDYFEKAAFTSMTTEQFEERLGEHVRATQPALLDRLQIRAWIHDPGLPSSVPVIASEEFAKVEREAQKWFAGTPATRLATSGWTTHHWLHFLQILPESLSTKNMAELDKAFRFTASGNSEILGAWLERCIKTHYAAADAALERFLMGQGRRKFLRPLYAALAKSPEGLARARRIYAKARPMYHSVSYRTVDEILHWETPGAQQ